MKKLLLLLLLCSASFTRQAGGSEVYTYTVHVTATRWIIRPFYSNSQEVLHLSALINGKKVELESIEIKAHVILLKLGNYPAKLVRDERKTSYEISQTYQLLMPDGTKRNFVVVGQSE